MISVEEFPEVADCCTPVEVRLAQGGSEYFHDPELLSHPNVPIAVTRYHLSAEAVVLMRARVERNPICSSLASCYFHIEPENSRRAVVLLGVFDPTKGEVTELPRLVGIQERQQIGFEDGEPVYDFRLVDDISELSKHPLDVDDLMGPFREISTKPEGSNSDFGKERF